VLCDVVELKGSFNPRGMTTRSSSRAGAGGAPEISSVRMYYIGAVDGLIRRIIATTEINGVAGPSTETRYTLGKADPASAFTFERLAAAVKPLIGDKPFPEVRTGLNDIGQPLPEVGGKLADGKDLRWQDFHGKVLVVETWATWCTFCKHAMPYYEKVRKQLAGKDVVFVQLNFEEKEALYEKWVRDNSGRYGFIFARGEMTAQNWQEKLNDFKGSLPGFYVVGRDGKIVAAYRGFGYGDGGEDPRLIPALEKAGIQVQARAGEASAPGP
jgi:thiol-disulfide isomerase/thioredoxin